MSKLQPVVDEFFEFYRENYACFQNITPTLHKICHLKEIVDHFSQYNLGLGSVSEQTLELAHKFTKSFKKKSFCASRKTINRDVFDKFSTLTHPLISNIITDEFKSEKAQFKMMDDSEIDQFFYF